MTTTPRHPLVEEYLAELERRSARLPPGTRRELLAEIREHVDAGTAEARSEAGIRNMLESLGSPDDIVGASEPDGTATSAGAGSVPTGRLALGFGIAALVLAPIPFLGFFTIPFGVTAVVLGVRARRRLRSAGLPTSTATAGAVTGGIAVAVVVLMFAILVPVRTSTSSESEPLQVGPSSTILEAPTTTGVG